MRRRKRRYSFVTAVISLMLIAVIAHNAYYIYSLKEENKKVPRIVTLRKEAAAVRFPEDRDELPFLRRKARHDEALLEIVKNYEEYPEELTGFLTANPAQIDFVKNYDEKAGHTYGPDTLTGVSKGMVPLLIQWDGRWGYADLGDFCIGTNGCGPTCLTMVYASLTGDNTKTPCTFSEFADENDYYVDEVGSKWSLMTDGAAAFGIKGRELGLSRENVLRELEKGRPIICSMRKGDFTYGGHFIVLAGATEDGRIKVNDPNSPWRSLILWDYERIEPQISGLWSFSR